MKRFIIFVAVLLLAGCRSTTEPVVVGAPAPANYFPLAVGNKWMLSTTQTLPASIPKRTVTVAVTGSIEHNGNTFYIVRGIQNILPASGDSVLLRNGAHDTVYMLIGDKEFVYLAFSTPAESTLSLTVDPAHAKTLLMRSKNDSVQSGTRLFRNCAEVGTIVEFGDNIPPYGWVTAFSRGVGPVEHIAYGDITYLREDVEDFKVNVIPRLRIPAP